jgi:polyisoprenoid-binding protein YceI
MTDTAEVAQGVTHAGTWQVDVPHSTVGFRVRHLGGFASVRGGFTDYDGTIEVGEDPAASRLEATIRVASLSTLVPDRDATLLGETILDAERHPEIRFASTRLRADGDGVRIDGDLTIKGVTRPVVLEGTMTPGRDARGYERLFFDVRARLNTADFGFEGRSDDVELVLEISGWREPAAQ